MKNNLGTRTAVLLLAWTCLLGVGAAEAPLPTVAAPFYALPAPGAWAQFDCTHRDAAGKEVAGTLRLAHVGSVAINGQPHAWVEIKLTPDAKEPNAWKLRKLLVAVERYRQAGDLSKAVAEAHQQSGPNQPARPMTDAALATFLRMGLAQTLALESQGDEEELATPAGKWRCRRAQGTARDANQAARCTVWRCADAAFGLAQFTMTVEPANSAGKSEFRATLARTGDKARAELPVR